MTAAVALIGLVLALVTVELAPRAATRLRAALAGVPPAHPWPWPRAFLVMFCVLNACHLVAIAICGARADCQFRFEPLPPALDPVMRLVIMVLVMSVLEEVLFRGFLLAWLLRRMVFARANLWQAAAFTLFHPIGDLLDGGTIRLVALVPIFIAGLLLGHLARRERGLKSPVAAHLGYNVPFVLLAPSTMVPLVDRTLAQVHFEPNSLAIYLSYLLGITLLLTLLLALARRSPLPLPAAMPAQPAPRTLP